MDADKIAFWRKQRDDARALLARHQESRRVIDEMAQQMTFQIFTARRMLGEHDK